MGCRCSMKCGLDRCGGDGPNPSGVFLEFELLRKAFTTLFLTGPGAIFVAQVCYNPIIFLYDFGVVCMRLPRFHTGITGFHGNLAASRTAVFPPFLPVHHAFIGMWQVICRFFHSLRFLPLVSARSETRRGRGKNSRNTPDTHNCQKVSIGFITRIYETLQFSQTRTLITDDYSAFNQTVFQRS